ncbi:hypothetical protein [uncultured Methanobrevibacter sp.]|uniref:hypothetical protein n=1 Tax=uncultured Methanobrevibacter sp. TaxID=253161 RepID=UPI002620EE0A|nr:hypothetical protein [uncultured Methanobrevibacter sp.]
MNSKNSKQLMLCPNCHLFVPKDNECVLCGHKLKHKKEVLSEYRLNKSFKRFFNHDSYIIWDLEFIPKSSKNKLNCFYNDFFDISYSKLTYGQGVIFHYFSKYHKSRPYLTLIYNINVKKSNFRLYDNQLLVFLKIKYDLDLFKENFSLKYASKNKDSCLYYISLGDIESSDLIKNLDLLIDFSNYVSNPLLGNYKFHKDLDTLKWEHYKKNTKKKSKHAKTRVEYNNGYAVGEGMSISGKKQRKGSFKRRNNNEGEGFVIPRRISYHDYDR